MKRDDDILGLMFLPFPGRRKARMALVDVAKRLIAIHQKSLTQEGLSDKEKASLVTIRVEAEAIMFAVTIDHALTKVERLIVRLFRFFLLAVRRVLFTQRNQVQIQTASPPRVAELLVALVTSKKQRAAIIGDLEEMFHESLDKGWSVNRANWRYWGFALGTVKDQVWPAIKRIGLLAILSKLVK